MVDAPPPPPKKRRWKKILGIAGAVLLGLVLLTLLLIPPIAGAVIRSKVPALLGEQLGADVTLQGASFSWSGRVVILGLRAVPKGFTEPLLDVERIEAVVSIGAALGGRYLADVDILRPRVFIERDAAGRSNAQKSPGASGASTSSAGTPAPPPFVQAVVRVREGSFVLKEGAGETRFTFGAEAKVDTLQKPIAWSAALGDASGGKVSAKGEFDLERRAGPLAVVIERLSLANLGAAARTELDGTLDGRLEGTTATEGRADLKIREFRAGRLLLGDAALTFDGRTLGLKLGALLKAKAELLDGPGGKIRLEIDLDLKETVAGLRHAGLLKADLRAEGGLGLRGTLGLSPPAWSLESAAPRVLLTLGGKPVLLEDVVHRSAGALDDAGSGWATLDVRSGKALAATLKAEVTTLFRAPALKATLDASSELAELGRLLEKLLGFKDGLTLEGRSTLQASVDLKSADPGRLELTATTSDLAAIDASKKRILLDKAIELRAGAAWDGRTSTASVDALKLSSSVATLDGRGGVVLTSPPSVRDSSFILAADLSALGAKLGQFLADPPVLGGKIDAKGSYAGDRFELTATGSGVKVGRAGPMDGTLVQKGRLSLAPGGGLDIETAELRSSALHAVLSGAVKRILEPDREGELKLGATLTPAELARWLPELGLGGEPVPLTATLGFRPGAMTAVGHSELKLLKLGAKTLKAAPIAFDLSCRGEAWKATLQSALVEWSEPGYAGKAGLEASVEGTSTSNSGTTKLMDLEVVDGRKNAVKEPAVTLLHAVDLAPGSILLRKADIESGFLRGGLRGLVKTPAGGMEFEQVAGSFSYLPERLGAVLKPWLAGGALSGGEWKTLTLALDGPAPPGGRSRLDVDLATYTHTGVAVSGRSTFTLENGVLRTSSPFDVNKGRAELTALFDLRGKEQKPQSAFDFQAKEVDANADMAPFLSAINPIFYTVNGTLGGKATADVRLLWSGPLDPEAAGTSLRGGGTLAVKELLITGSPAMGLLLQALGEGNQLAGELLATDLRIQNGRCEYANMTLRLARYELRFTGWVGFDKELKLMVEMPLTPHMKKKYPGLEKYLGATIPVPLNGTAASPRLDFERVIEEALKRAAPTLLEDALRKLLDRKKK